MAENNKQIEVVIDDKAYKLSGVENEKYIRNIAEYIDKKIKEISSSAIGVAKNSSAFLVLVGLNIADDFFKEKDSVKAKLKKATDNLTVELNKLKNENDEKNKKIEELELQIKEQPNKIEADESISQQAEIYKREYENLLAQMKEVKLELNKAKSQLGSAKCELEKHKTEKNDLKISLENNQKETDEIKAVLENEKKENDRLKESLDNAQNDNNELRVALEAVKKENNVIKNGYDKLKDSQSGEDSLKIAQLERELEDTCQQLEAYKKNAEKNNELIEKAQNEAEQAKAELAEYIETFSV